MIKKAIRVAGISILNALVTRAVNKTRGSETGKPYTRLSDHFGGAVELHLEVST